MSRKAAYWGTEDVPKYIREIVPRLYLAVDYITKGRNCYGSCLFVCVFSAMLEDEFGSIYRVEVRAL